MLAHPARLGERGIHQGRARGAPEAGGKLGLALLSCVLFPGARVPAVRLEKFSKLSRCRPRPTKGRGESCALPPGGCGTCSGRRVPTGCGVARCRLSEEARWPLAGSGREPRLQAASVGRRVGSRVAAAGGRRLEAGAGGGAGAGRAVGHRWVEGRRSLPGSGLRVGVRAPAPFPSLERGDPRDPRPGSPEAGRDARGSGRVSARGSGDAARCGRGHLGDLSPGLQG